MPWDSGCAVRQISPDFEHASVLNGKSFQVMTQTERVLTMQHVTRWQIQPSLKYDMLSFLSALTADPFYLRYYQAEYDLFASRFTVEVRQALDDLRQKIKGAGNLVGPMLAYVFSITQDETPDALLLRLDDPDPIKQFLIQRKSEEQYGLFESVFDELRVIFNFFRDVDFPGYWLGEIEPRVRARIAEIEASLPQYDIVPVVEQCLGFALPSDQVTVYMIYFCRPHGVSITGGCFLTDIAYPFSIVMQNAIHEMMHPPYQWDNDTELRVALELLRQDAFFMDKVENHNPDFGYNSFEGLLEEDIVQALDQIICDHFDVGHKDARTRFKRADDGIHVLAIVLYEHLRALDFVRSGRSIRAVLLDLAQEGFFSPGALQAAYDALYADFVEDPALAGLR